MSIMVTKNVSMMMKRHWRRHGHGAITGRL
jgi:hypothetical protein